MSEPNRGGRPKKFSDDQVRAVRDRVYRGELTITEACRKAGMFRGTFYNRVPGLDAQDGGTDKVKNQLLRQAYGLPE